MRINEILIESQQLDEGPFGQAVGKAVGGLAKGVGAVAGGIAGIPGAVKKGFKAGKAAVSGDPAADTTADPAATTTAPTQAAPVQKADPAATSGVKQGLTKAFAAPAATTSAPAANTAAAPAANATPAPTADATPAPAADPAAEKAAKIGVGQINKIIPTLRTRDLMSLQTNLEKAIAGKKKAAPAAPADAAQSAAPAAETPAPKDSGAPASGGVQGIKSNVDINKLQKFDGIVDVTPKIKPQVKDAKGRTWTKLTGGWTMDGSKREISRQDSTYQSFDDAWRVANGAQPKNAGIPKAKVASTQAEIDADRARLMGANSESTVKKSRMMAESFSLYRRQH
jgi:hypothetical protein